jgi:hypothetical protein
MLFSGKVLASHMRGHVLYLQHHQDKNKAKLVRLRRPYVDYRSKTNAVIYFLKILLFICAYKAWVISSPCPHPLPYHPLHPLLLPPIPSIPSRNYFALISNFVVERV